MQKNQILSWVSVVVWMCVIFMFSEQDGIDSGNLSGSVVDTMTRILSVLHIKTPDVSTMSFVVRKLAHMFIYFVLALLIMNAFRFSSLKMISTILYTVLICFIYACSDEFHQSFSPGRTMAFRDVIIDTVGAILGISAFIATTHLGQRLFTPK